MARFPDLPADVIFELLSILGLRDGWSLSLVSRALRHLSTDRSFWIIALKTCRSISSVSNPMTVEDLHAMDLVLLKKLALHFLQLDRNWARPCPRIIGAVRTAKFAEGLAALQTHLLLQFPGSDIFIFCSDKLVKCFNFGQSTCTTLFDLGEPARAASFNFIQNRVVLLGITSSTTVYFIRVELESTKSNATATLLLMAPLSVETACHKPFVGSVIVGAVQNRGMRTEILAFNLISGASTVITTDIPINYTLNRRLDFSFHGEGLYLLADDGPRACVYWCPGSAFPYGSNPPPTANISFGDVVPSLFPTTVSRSRGRRPFCCPMLRDARFVKVHDALAIDFATTFRFWDPTTLGVVPPPEICVPGVCAGELKMQISPTGEHLVAALLGPLGSRLFLIRWNADRNSCSAHELELPAGLGTRSPPNVLAVDDHQGVVWLLESGKLLAVQYA